MHTYKQINSLSSINLFCVLSTEETADNENSYFIFNY